MKRPASISSFSLCVTTKLSQSGRTLLSCLRPKASDRGGWESRAARIEAGMNAGAGTRPEHRWRESPTRCSGAHDSDVVVWPAGGLCGVLRSSIRPVGIGTDLSAPRMGCLGRSVGGSIGSIRAVRSSH